jgi:catechol 2,3-dioxygenase-like lactoylglutathione lyase family enzyme
MLVADREERTTMAPRLRLHHIDLTVGDVQRSLEFYLALLGPFGLHEFERWPSYRGTEEIVYLAVGDEEQYLGLRPADGGEHRYHNVGLEHFAFYVDTREEVDAAYQRCLDLGVEVHFPPEEDRDIEGYYELFVWDPDGIRVEIACGPPRPRAAAVSGGSSR